MLLIFAIVITFSCQWCFTEAFADSGLGHIEGEPLKSSSGTCGTNLTWTLDDNGTLTISGTGAMQNYTSIPTSPWYADRQSIVKVVIKSGVTSIGNSAFTGCSNLTGVTIPSSVTSIGSNAFSGCSSMTSITIPSAVTNIGSGAFASCRSLTRITIPSKVTAIEDGTFYGCSGLTSVTLPSGITSIGKQAFQNCSSLTSITLPSSLTSIGVYGFSGCSGLKNITIPSGVTSIGQSTFANCSSLASITLPSGLTSIGSSAFFYCTSLKSINIPNSVTSIGSSAFRLCTSLTSVTIPSRVTSIEGSTFSECSALASVTIPGSVTKIGGSAFYRCTSLTGITIPDSVVSIEGCAFQYCSNLASINIPDGVTSIGNYTFEGCISLPQITLPDGVTSIGEYAFHNCSSLTDVNIPSGVTSIEVGTFYGCSRLTGIIIPEGVASIGDYAFRDCSRLTGIIIPESVTSIGMQAFLSCSGLKSITIPSTVTGIGTDGFSLCNNVQYIFYGGTEEQWAVLVNRPTKGIVHYESTDHTCGYVADIEATCTESGHAVWHCIYCDYSDHAHDETVIPPLGHDWNDAEYTWEDDYSKVTATRLCKRDAAHEETETVNTTSEVTKPATCEEGGETTYRAVFTNEAFQDQSQTIVNINALGHRWDEGVVIEEPTYFDEGLILYTCQNDPSHTYTEILPKLDRPDDPIILRLAGANRTATAIEAAKHLKEQNGVEKFDNIIIASGTGFADALSASYLAYKKDGPILLVDKSSITTVADFVNDNLAPGGTVFIAGGSGAVPYDVDEKIKAVSGEGSVVRLAGNDRYLTNILVLDEAGVEGEDLLVASGTGFADALSASAAKKPIFLVGQSLNESQLKYLNSHATSLSGRYYIIGGIGAVAPTIDGVLGNYGTVKRLEGSNRFATSIAVADEFFPGDVDTVVIANGMNFPDGLSGGPIAAEYGAPLVLVTDKNYSHATEHFAKKGAFRLVIMGGTGVISDQTALTIANDLQ